MTAAPSDTTFTIGGFDVNPALETLRTQIPEIFTQIDGYADAVLSPASASDPFTAAERALVAQRVAELIPSPALDAWYGVLLAERDGIPREAFDSPRIQAMLHRVRIVNTHPDTTTAKDVQALFTADLTHGEVIALSQLIAFVHYQARLLVGLRAIANTDRSSGASKPVSLADAGDHPNLSSNHAGARSGERQTTFTQRVLDWQPWLETIDEIEATPEQLAVVDAIAGARQGRAYWATLAHDPISLQARMALYGNILSGEQEGRGPRADRELAATATSRVTSCVYCASVHSRAFSALVKDRDRIQRLLDDGPDAELPPRERAIVDYSVRLALTPDAVRSADLQPLRDLGLTDLELLDITNAAAIFANANRLMATLGEARTPDR